MLERLLYVGDMDKKPRKKKRDYDFSVTAFQVVQEATKEQDAVIQAEEKEEITSEGKNPSAVARGRLGVQKGGKS